LAASNGTNANAYKINGVIMTEWRRNTDIRDDKYEDVSNTDNAELAMEVMAKTTKGKCLIEKAMKKLKEIGDTEI